MLYPVITLAMALEVCEEIKTKGGGDIAIKAYYIVIIDKGALGVAIKANCGSVEEVQVCPIIFYCYNYIITTVIIV